MPTPARLNYYAYSFLSGEYQGTLVGSAVTFGDTLNTSDSMSLTIPMADPEVQALQPLALTVPGQNVIVVDYNGLILGTYVITGRKRSLGKQGIAMVLTAKSLYWWFTKRVQAADYSSPPFSSISGGLTPMTIWSQQPYDACLITAQIISDALAYYQFGTIYTGTDVLGGMAVMVNNAAPGSPVVPAGDWVYPTFPYSSLATLDSIIQQQTGYGFLVGHDISVTAAYSNGPFSPLVGTINIVYPRLGRTAAANNVVIDARRERAYDFDEASDTQAIVAYMTGVTGSLAIVENVAPVEQGWPILEQIFSQSNLAGPNAVEILQELGDTDSFLNSFPSFSGTVTVSLWGTDPQLGQFIVGDSAMLYMAPDANFPDGLVLEMRIVGWRASIPAEGDATMDLTLNVPPLASPALGPALPS